MDIGQLHNNYKYYIGFEDEEEVLFSLESDHEISIHVWIGYIDDILREPNLDGSGWKGMTKDYHQLEGAFADTGKEMLVYPDEYLKDLEYYAKKIFEYEETGEVYKLIITFLEYAIKQKSCVIIRVE